MRNALAAARYRPGQTTRVVLALMTAVVVVHCGTVRTWGADEMAAKQVKNPASGLTMAWSELPPHVAEMRDLILAAVRSGRIEDLEPAIAQNELPPEFGSDAPGDAISQLKALSEDGSGHDILAVLGNVLDTEPARLPIGRDVENNIVFVWPGVSERPLDQLTGAEQVTILRLMPPDQAKVLRDGKKWTWWRLAIGSDGTWLTFMKPVPSK